MNIVMFYRIDDEPKVTTFKTYNEFKNYIQQLKLVLLDYPPELFYFPLHSAFVISLGHDGHIITEIDS